MTDPAGKAVRLDQLAHVILDLDGTIYLDGDLFPETRPFLDGLAALGIGHTFITNNNSRSRAEYVELLRQHGLAATKDSVFTSAHATLHFLREELPHVNRPFVLGTPSLCDEFQIAGYRIANPAGINDEPPDAVVIGFDRTLSYGKLARAAYWISQGLPYLATHPDRICPTQQPTMLPDCGALTALFESATGRAPDAIPGKPSPAMVQGVLQYHRVASQRAAMVGDRLYTDIKMAKNAKMISVLTLTGETTREEAAASPVKPDLVVDNLSHLLTRIEQACGP